MVQIDEILEDEVGVVLADPQLVRLVLRQLVDGVIR